MSSPKYFGFVEQRASGALSWAGDAYASLKSKALPHSPQFVETVFAKSEDLATPIVSRVQSLSHSALMFADSTVQSSFNLACNAASSTRSAADRVVGEERMATVDRSVQRIYGSALNTVGTTLSTAQETMVAVRQEGVVPVAKRTTSAAWERASALPGRLYAGASSTYQQTSEAVGERLQAVWNTKTGENVKSRAVFMKDFTSKHYMAFHDDVMSKQAYANTHHVLSSTWSWLTTQPVVAGPWSSLYPHVKGIVDPALERASPYVQKLSSHLEPQAKPSAQMSGDAPATGNVSPSSS